MTTTGVRVARLEQVPPGAMLAVDVDGTPVLLVNSGGTVFAVLDECSHDGAPLSEGELEGESVVCPWHFSRFCLRTGRVLESPALDDVRVWTVQVVDTDVYLS